MIVNYPLKNEQYQLGNGYLTYSIVYNVYHMIISGFSQVQEFRIKLFYAQYRDDKENMYLRILFYWSI